MRHPRSKKVNHNIESVGVLALMRKIGKTPPEDHEGYKDRVNAIMSQEKIPWDKLGSLNQEVQNAIENNEEWCNACENNRVCCTCPVAELGRDGKKKVE